MASTRRTKGAGNVRKLPSGRFQARFVGSDGQRHTAPVTFQTKGDATEWLNAQMKAVRNDSWVAPRKLKIDRNMTLNDFFDHWIPNQDHRRETTDELYESQWRRLVRESLGTLPLATITEETVARWRRNLDRDTPTQRKQVYSLLRQVLNAAVQEKLIPYNPAQNFTFAATELREPDILTPSEVIELANNMPPRYRALVYVSAWCALRFGESAGLQRNDIDLNARIIHVRKAVVRTKSGSRLGPPKSRAGLRKVTIPPNIVSAIENHLSEFVDKESSALVFPGANGRFLAPSTLYKVFYPAREAIGYPEMHWHDLRHTGATMAAQVGATLREIQDRLGHSTVAAAMRYQHSTDTRQAELAEKLGKLADSK